MYKTAFWDNFLSLISSMISFDFLIVKIYGRFCLFALRKMHIIGKEKTRKLKYVSFGAHTETH